MAQYPYQQPGNGVLPTVQGEIGYFGSNFAAYGNAFIVWGTDSILGSYIVTTASESQRIEEINIAQGSGFTAILILLLDGITVDIEVVDDTSIIPIPGFGSTVTLATPWGAIPMVLVKNDANQARKREGMRTFTFKSFVGILGLH